MDKGIHNQVLLHVALSGKTSYASSSLLSSACKSALHGLPVAGLDRETRDRLHCNITSFAESWRSSYKQKQFLHSLKSRVKSEFCSKGPKSLAGNLSTFSVIFKIYHLSFAK